MRGQEPAEWWELEALGRCPHGHYKKTDGTLYLCDYCGRQCGPCPCMVEEHVRHAHILPRKASSSH